MLQSKLFLIFLANVWDNFLVAFSLTSFFITTKFCIPSACSSSTKFLCQLFLKFKSSLKCLKYIECDYVILFSDNKLLCFKENNKIAHKVKKQHNILFYLNWEAFSKTIRILLHRTDKKKIAFWCLVKRKYIHVYLFSQYKIWHDNTAIC